MLEMRQKSQIEVHSRDNVAGFFYSTLVPRQLFPCTQEPPQHYLPFPQDSLGFREITVIPISVQYSRILNIIQLNFANPARRSAARRTCNKFPAELITPPVDSRQFLAISPQLHLTYPTCIWRLR